jgi:mannose-6-phosphate isomerase-like protein (cupin superfamily)
MFRRLTDIAPVTTSHGVGQKRVLLSSNESGCSLTQIAVTELKAGEIAAAHVHPDMQEGFYVLDGELDIVLNGEIEHCKAEDFVYVKCGSSHELRAITDVRVMTIGCETTCG